MELMKKLCRIAEETEDSMIVDTHIAAYIDSLEKDLNYDLRELEKKALADHVPIIRKSAQSLLRFFITMQKPKRILEVGTAVGFSCSFMSEYMGEDCTITTIEKVPMRILSAKENLSKARRKKDISLLIGDATDVLKALTKEGGEICEIYYPSERCSDYKEDENFLKKIENYQGLYDFIFMDAAKGQYMNFLPDIMKLLSIGGTFITDNVLQEGSIADSKFSITRRDRTIHMRMREYLYTLTHMEELETVILPIGDGISLSTRKK